MGELPAVDKTVDKPVVTRNSIFKSNIRTWKNIRAASTIAGLEHVIASKMQKRDMLFDMISV